MAAKNALVHRRRFLKICSLKLCDIWQNFWFYCILTHSLLEILPKKRVLKLVKWFSGHYRAITSYNLPQTGLQVIHFAAYDPDAKYQLAKFGHAQKAKFRDFGFKSDPAVLTFTFRFLSSLLFFHFSCLIFFSCWAFSRLHFGGKSF